MTKITSSDQVGYRGGDSGCSIATEYLGEQSLCLDCPFERCMENVGELSHLKKQQRKELILKLFGEGKSTEEVAQKLGLSKRTVYRVVRDV